MVTMASLQTLAAMLERREVTSPDIHSFSLADGGEALAALATGHTRGKIVVVA